MKLIVGLGNPGNQYILNRHNIGFAILDYIASSYKRAFQPGKGDWYEIQFINEGIEFYIIKPSTYMNNSGLPVLDFILKYHVELKDVLIVLDDFQLPMGTIRVRNGGSDGGHNGLLSVIYQLSTLDFPRMRVGIGKQDVAITKEDYSHYVLSDFIGKEIDELNLMMTNYHDCVINFIKNGITDTMNKFNRNFLAPKEEKPKEEKPKEEKKDL
jgi:peptidyl-tRNA hydrolase, PTH1 family